MNYTANDRELFGLTMFLERFRWYLEERDSAVLRIIKYWNIPFSKKTLIKRETKCIETLGNFGIFRITFKPDKIHLLEDALSRAPHAKGDASLNGYKYRSYALNMLLAAVKTISSLGKFRKLYEQSGQQRLNRKWNWKILFRCLEWMMRSFCIERIFVCTEMQYLQ